MSRYAEAVHKPARAAPAPRVAAASPAGHEASPAVQALEATGRSLNARADVVAQRALGERLSAASAVQRAPANRTGLPDALKAGVEAASGVSLDDVRVHRNSAAPAQLQAHAFAQGAEIHVAPGQERHLPHEAWHVVQQKQGRVQPTVKTKGGPAINDDVSLEREADVMGARALDVSSLPAVHAEAGVAQRLVAPRPGRQGEAEVLDRPTTP